MSLFKRKKTCCCDNKFTSETLKNIQNKKMKMV